MKIAVPTKYDNQIDDHFGHCEFYTVFTVSAENKIVDLQIIKALKGCGCKSDIAHVLALNGVSIMLAGGIGNGAINVLNASGIKVVRGCSGNARENAEKYLLGSIVDSGNSCQHHNQYENHVCNH